MTVYNGEKYLGEAIDSILAQTYSKFELIIVDDGSTDLSQEIIKSYKDSRVRLISQKNQGVSKSCNKAFKLARGEYIARHDADDISHPDRLSQQILFMESHKDVGLLGSNYKVIDEAGCVTKVTNIFTDPSDVKIACVLSNQFGQGSVIMRKSSIPRIPYDPKYRIAHDYDLWVRLSRNTKIANLKAPLYLWRSIGEGLSTKTKNQQQMWQEIMEIQEREFQFFKNNRKKYSLIRWHIFSTKYGPITYLYKSSKIYRDLAVRYTRNGLRRKSMLLLFASILYAPWSYKSYKQTFLTIFNKRKVRFL